MIEKYKYLARQLFNKVQMDDQRAWAHFEQVTHQICCTVFQPSSALDPLTLQ